MHEGRTNRTHDTLWVRERDGVYVVDMMVSPAGREQKSKPSCGRWDLQWGLYVQLNHQRTMTCGTEGSCTRWKTTIDWMRARGSAGNEEDEDEEQEEEHQKERAIASPDSPSRRAVEEDLQH